ncbi:MAG: hypothetical protein CSA58_01345 [Micrococcales bacterium]|nr:MAG: hypothetical protein CSA58_01345 [Micrococcales bacterium]
MSDATGIHSEVADGGGPIGTVNAVTEGRTPGRAVWEKSRHRRLRLSPPASAWKIPGTDGYQAPVRRAGSRTQAGGIQALTFCKAAGIADIGGSMQRPGRQRTLGLVHPGWQ